MHTNLKQNKDMEYTAIIKKMSNGWYFAQCEQVPNAITQGETIEEALENLQTTWRSKDKIEKKFGNNSFYMYVCRQILKGDATGRNDQK